MLQDKWYSKDFRKIHFDMHTPGHIQNVGRDFDPARFARELKEAGFQAVSYFAKDTYGWSYYPTKIGARHPGLDYDLLGRGVEEMRKQGLHVIAYYALGGHPTECFPEHPAWHRRDEKGEVMLRKGGGTLGCFFGPFMHEYLLPQIREIASNYDIQGFFFDGLPWPCHCDSCKAWFGPAPAADDAAAQRDYGRRVLERQRARYGEFFDEIHRTHPHILAGINYMGSFLVPIVPPENTGYLSGDVWVAEDFYVSTDYLLANWGWRGIPCDSMNTRMLGSWQDFTYRSQDTLRAEAGLTLSRGATYFVGDLLTPQSLALDPDVLALERAVNEFIEEREEACLGAEPVADVAVLHHQGKGTIGHEKVEFGQAAFLALVEEGWTAQVLYEEDLSTQLPRFKALMLSNGPELSIEAQAVVESFVASGGSLIFAGEIPKANRPFFEKLLGVRVTDEEPYKVSYLYFKDQPIAHRMRRLMGALPPIVCHMPTELAMANGASVICHLTAPGEEYQIGALPPGHETPYIGLSIRKANKGRAIYTPMPLAMDFWNRGNFQAKYLLGEMIADVVDKPMARALSEANVEVCATQRGNERMFHVLYRGVEGRPLLPRLSENVPTLHGIQLMLHLDKPPVEMRMIPGNANLNWREVGGAYLVDLPPVKIHGCCVVKVG